MSAATDRIADLLGMFDNQVTRLKLGSAWTEMHTEVVKAARQCLRDEVMVIDHELNDCDVNDVRLREYLAEQKQTILTFLGE